MSTERLRELDQEIEAWERFTDKHPYPSGVNKLIWLRGEREHLTSQLNIDTTQRRETQ